MTGTREDSAPACPLPSPVWSELLGSFKQSARLDQPTFVSWLSYTYDFTQDGIYPGVKWFAKGFNANNDPWRGYVLVFLVAMGFVMIAKLNAIGVVASNFFLAAYALMNLSCFHSDYTNAPNWRPSFKVVFTFLLRSPL